MNEIVDNLIKEMSKVFEELNMTNIENLDKTALKKLRDYSRGIFFRYTRNNLWI